MELADAPVHDLRPLLTAERADLVTLLHGLDDEQWRRPGATEAWSVQDVALHVLDGDLGVAVAGRDDDRSSLLDPSDFRSFVTALDAKNQRWVEASRGLSRQVVAGLLEWSGHQVDAYARILDPTTPDQVVWAGGEVPAWLAWGRDFTERWVHQQQIREVLDLPGDHDRYLPGVLRTFVWAFPAQLSVDAPEGSEVSLVLGDGGTWLLTRTAGRWELDEGQARQPIAALALSADTAWRLLTGAPYDPGSLRHGGPDELVESLLAVRSIIV